MSGEVVGITNMKITFGEGLGFAIPIDRSNSSSTSRRLRLRNDNRQPIITWNLPAASVRPPSMNNRNRYTPNQTQGIDKSNQTRPSFLKRLGHRRHSPLQLISSPGAIPPAEKILPDDTLVLTPCPTSQNRRFEAPSSQFWNDPAMKRSGQIPVALEREFVKPLERDLNIRFDDYISLPPGQVTFALVQNGWQGGDDNALGVLLLIDAKDKSSQLKSNLTDLRRKWVDGGKSIKTEKIRDLEFTVLTVSSNDIPKTLRSFLPDSVSADAPDPDSPKPQSKTQLVIGQFESLLIVSSSVKTAEKVVARLAGGSIPALGEQSIYQANHQALFREALFYGWANTKTFIDIFTRKAEKKDSDADSMGMKPEKTRSHWPDGFEVGRPNASTFERWRSSPGFPLRARVEPPGAVQDPCRRTQTGHPSCLRAGRCDQIPALAD
jgi:hypothetical protein